MGSMRLFSPGRWLRGDRRYAPEYLADAQLYEIAALKS